MKLKINLTTSGKVSAFRRKTNSTHNCPILQAAAALIAAAASGGDPEIANKIIEKMMSGRRGKRNTIRIGVN
jgi:NifU-like protein involved in Fe-S cluster formation